MKINKNSENGVINAKNGDFIQKKIFDIGQGNWFSLATT
jgi:hypothetical protein